ncbi:Hypothetical protein R9X50_00040500 [Acrodontium crateriforme]|uniref:C2H2-type domain-containing protein n=1 Tax=Acrodontium crateriforme TaxID=150365 RepID=A0AAQ3M0L1_9PEZI|nr:Hypothetical protein R9X50_00040500 [Acrodontium crateriforme]
MIPGADPMGAPSFTARRPNASHLPSFELPPPPATFHPNKFNFPMSSSQPNASLTSVGNLLTPPSNSSADGLSPLPSAVTTGTSMTNTQVFSPNSMWQTQNSSYGGYQSTGAPFGRALYSPSLNSMVRSSPTSEGLPPPPYEVSQFNAPSMSASSLSNSSSLINNTMMTPVSASASQTSPVHAQDAFSRHSTNGYSSYASTPQQGTFSYSNGPSSIHSPISAGGSMTKMSPVNGHGQIPSLHSQQQQYSRYGSYGQGPVLSNINNPNGHLSLVGGGMHQHSMMPGYNSGHAAHMGHHMYNQQQSTHNDRPFKCDQCPQSFNRNHDLKRHKRIHLAVKPFPCGHCDKSFSRKDALKRHVLVKGCGRAHASDDSKLDGSISPASKSESVHTSPIVTASA